MAKTRSIRSVNLGMPSRDCQWTYSARVEKGQFMTMSQSLLDVEYMVGEILDIDLYGE